MNKFVDGLYDLQFCCLSRFAYRFVGLSVKMWFLGLFGYRQASYAGGLETGLLVF